jgi:hypothetical protein
MWDRSNVNLGILRPWLIAEKRLGQWVSVGVSSCNLSQFDPKSRSILDHGGFIRSNQQTIQERLLAACCLQLSRDRAQA